MKYNIFILLLWMATSAFSQEGNRPRTDTLSIVTSAQCGMCKERIEKTLAYEKGVVDVTLDLKTKIVTVVYNPRRTQPDAIRLAITQTGYDADQLKADEKAYKRLPPCCKKPDDPDYRGHGEHESS